MDKVNLHYADLLFEELKKRCKKNAKYSLRSFARDLEISPSFLSRVLRRENALTLKKAQILVQKLLWVPSKKNIFFQLIHYHSCSPGAAKEALQNQLSKAMKNKKIEAFSLSRSHQTILTHWYDLAIIELTQHPDFVSTPRWISQRLAVSLAEVQESLRRLLSLGVLYYQKSSLKKSHQRYWIGDFHSKDIRAFHQQHLKIAGHAIQNQKMEERYFIGSTFPLHTSQIPRFQELIQEFNEKALNLAEEMTPNHVYHLAVQFYRLDQNSI